MSKMKCPYCKENLTIIKRGVEYHCYHCNRDLRRTASGGFCEVRYEEKGGSAFVGLIIFFLGLIGLIFSFASIRSLGALRYIVTGLSLLFIMLGIGIMSYRPYTFVGYPPLKETIFRASSLPPSIEGIGTPTEFEKTVALLLEKMGYSDVRHIGGPSDKAIDITCYKDGLLYAVQCKKFDSKHKVGSRAMQNFCVMIKEYHEIERGIFVTTSTFTKDAKDIAEKFNVELIDGHALSDLMQRFIERPQVPEQVRPNSHDLRKHSEGWREVETKTKTNVKDDFHMDYITHMRALRELNRAARGRYEVAGVKEWKWLASTDSCSICISLNGKRFPITKTHVPPIHPNCTCTIVPVTDTA